MTVEIQGMLLNGARIAGTCACIALLVWLARRSVRTERVAGRRVRFSLLAWPLAYVCGLVICLVFLVLGHVDASLVTITPFLLVVTGCGAATFLRPRTHDAVMGWICRHLSSDRGRSVALGAIYAAALLLAGFSAIYALEHAWTSTPFTDGPRFAWLEYSFVLLLLGFLYFLAQRRGVVAAVAVCCLGCFGVAVHYVLCFKGTMLTPGDVYGMFTAAEVSHQYTFLLSQSIVDCMTIVAPGILVLSLVHPESHGEGRARRCVIVANLACAAVLAGGLVWFQCYSNLAQDQGVDLYYWDLQASSQSRGYLNTFVAEAQDLRVPAPPGYSKDGAEALEGSYASKYDADAGTTERRAQSTAQFDKLRPSIVVVMDESYANLSIFDRLQSGYEGTLVSSCSGGGTLLRGALMVNVYGGTTCNSEFEFLTGNSIAFMGYATTPFAMFNLSGTSSLPKQLSALGYDTTAIHPNLATNWNRNIIYPQLGFDKFLDIDDFTDAAQYHGTTSDAATYDKTLEVLGQSDDPQFIFDLTMQNHSGYDTGSIPEADRLDYEPAGHDNKDDTAILNEYLACIAQSDKALDSFVGRLRQLDRPVVLVYFGDHQPYFTYIYNNAFYPDENDLDHQERLHETAYLAWANYDVAGTDTLALGQTTSANFLAAQVLDRIGAPLTDYQKAQLVISKDVPALNFYGFLGTDGAWHATNEGGTELRQELTDLKSMQYLEFGSTV